MIPVQVEPTYVLMEDQAQDHVCRKNFLYIEYAQPIQTNLIK